MTHPGENEAILNGVLGQWKAALEAHDSRQIATLFTDDAIFQGLHPYSVGRQGVADYYESQPLGLTAAYRILETRRPADNLIQAYLAVDFSFADRPSVSVNLGLLVTHTDAGWLIAQYQVSRLP